MRALGPILLSLLFAVIQCDILVPSINATYPERIASFGPPLPDPLPLAGYLVPVEAFYPDTTTTTTDPAALEIHRRACHPLPARPHLDRPWIALVERGSCPFVNKVRAMQHSGAAAVIVGDLYPSGPLITMYASGDTSDVLIPSVFVARWESDVLRALALKNISHIHAHAASPTATPTPLPRLWVSLSPSTADFEELSFLSLLLLAILAPCALLFVIYTLWQWRSGELDALRAHHGRHSDLSMRVASPNMVARLAKVPYAPLQHSEASSHHQLPPPRSPTEPDLCAICLDAFVPDELLRQLPCLHLFHTTCIDPWLLTRRRTCPICKADIARSLPSPPLSNLSYDADDTDTNADADADDDLPSESDPLLQTNIDIQALNVQRYLQMSRSGSRRGLAASASALLVPPSPSPSASLPSDSQSFASLPASALSTPSTSHDDFQECTLDL